MKLREFLMFEKNKGEMNSRNASNFTKDMNALIHTRKKLNGS